MSNVTPGDIVNVRIAATPDEPVRVHRARVRKINASDEAWDLRVELPNGDEREVQWKDIEQRLKLPWRPESLRDHLIILRRRDCRREDYVEDLRVRRNMIKRLLQLLTKRAHWREDRGEEPLHAYYVGFDFMSDDELLKHFPEDDVPATLNIQDLSMADWPTAFSADAFHDWLYEGRNNCEVAEALLHTWTHHSQSDQDTIADVLQPCLQKSTQETETLQIAHISL